jgi:hypothetical protein
LVRVGDNGRCRHDGGQREGDCHNCEDLLHDGPLLSGSVMLPEPGAGLCDARHALGFSRLGKRPLNAAFFARVAYRCAPAPTVRPEAMKKTKKEVASPPDRHHRRHRSHLAPAPCASEKQKIRGVAEQRAQRADVAIAN